MSGEVPPAASGACARPYRAAIRQDDSDNRRRAVPNAGPPKHPLDVGAISRNQRATAKLPHTSRSSPASKCNPDRVPHRLDLPPAALEDHN